MASKTSLGSYKPTRSRVKNDSLNVKSWRSQFEYSTTMFIVWYNILSPSRNTLSFGIKQSGFKLKRALKNFDFGVGLWGARPTKMKSTRRVDAERVFVLQK